jgi:hypothetical protein
MKDFVLLYYLRHLRHPQHSMQKAFHAANE